VISKVFLSAYRSLFFPTDMAHENGKSDNPVKLMISLSPKTNSMPEISRTNPSTGGPVQKKILSEPIQKLMIQTQRPIFMNKIQDNLQIICFLSFKSIISILCPLIIVSICLGKRLERETHCLVDSYDHGLSFFQT
jgi:hypothetical protein